MEDSFKTETNWIKNPNLVNALTVIPILYDNMIGNSIGNRV